MNLTKIYNLFWGWGIGVWGLGIGDWGLGPIPNPQSPIPNPQSPSKKNYSILECLKNNKYNKNKYNYFLFSQNNTYIYFSIFFFLALI